MWCLRLRWLWGSARSRRVRARLLSRTSCFDPGDGTLQGELAVYIADDLELGLQTKKYAIRSATGEERWLDLDDASGLEAGARIKVWGNPSGDRFRVASLRQIAPPPSSPSPRR